MKYFENSKKESSMSRSPFTLVIKALVGGTLILSGLQGSLVAQESHYTKPTWYFGVAGGANINYYRSTTQQLNSVFSVPAAFYDGKGVGLYAAPFIEFHRPGTRLGFMLQFGYDSRKGDFKQQGSPCNCPEDLKTDLSYFTIEPSIRIAPFKSDFYLYAGPRFAFNTAKSFTYKLGINPAYPAQAPTPDVTGDFGNVTDNIVSMQIGAGYDIQISSQHRKTQFVLSPFVSFQPYFGQDVRNVEFWSITTLRAGIALKLGSGRKINEPVEVVIPAVASITEPLVEFSVNAPKNVPVERRVREIFPLRNYVFFNINSTVIPDRYVLLKKDQVKEFKEDQLEVFTPKELPGRSKRQMIVYYNVLNILGDRMGKNPTAVVVLSGATLEGPKMGKQMAESVKLYLVDVFGIEASRITTEGRLKPRIPSEQPGGTKELGLLREGDNRVSVWSESHALMMEFQSGPDLPMKPIELTFVEQAPYDSYVTFNVEGANAAFSSWALEVADEKGQIQYFGPYTQEKEAIPGKSILGTRPEGDYKITLIGQTKSGKVFKKETKAHLVLWTPPTNEEMMRFSIIYEFNDSKAITVYEKYLTEIVIPKIPMNATVILHGHTDIIGEEAHNLKLSLDRANDVKNILENGLAKIGRTDVKFEVHGYGEDQTLAPFENNFPEERFYNRTVVIDIVPAN